MEAAQSAQEAATIASVSVGSEVAGGLQVDGVNLNIDEQELLLAGFGAGFLFGLLTGGLLWTGWRMLGKDSESNEKHGKIK